MRYVVGFPTLCCLRVCLSAATAPTLGSEIRGREVSIVGEVYAGVTFTSTILCTSLVKSVTCL